MLWSGWMLLVACRGPAGAEAQIDLVSPLEAGQVRAGVVTDEAALLGGLSAEGRVGDIKIYNDRVAFVIQGARQGDYYVQEGGGVVDADVVRPIGQPGRDLVDEWGTMVGFGRVVSPDRIEVISDGSSGPAAVRVTGHDVGLGLLEGALEVEGFVASLGVQVTTDFVLYPDQWLMEVHTTVRALDSEAVFAAGDILMSGPEAADTWAEGQGMEGLGPDGRRWSAYVGRANDAAVGIFAWPQTTQSSAGAELLSELVFLVLGFGETTTLAPGASTTFSRYYGVGPDLATLTDAALAARGEATEALTGTVTAPDGPVAGARVAVQVDGAPFTLAFTDAEGRFEAQVPQGATTEALAIGRSDGLVLDLPAGAAPYGPYSPPTAAALTLDALGNGAPAIPLARGRGVGTVAEPLSLGEPGWLEVTSADGLPVSVQVGFVGGDPVGTVDSQRVHERPHGLAAAGWSRDADVVLPVEPGTYEVLVHRGMRFELHTEQVTVAAGQTVSIQADLGAGISPAGWLLGDPHAHASPSGDGEITMEGRLLVAAGSGTQVHFGTDHDHVADYRPLVDALGLDDVLTSVVADEVSPTLRGHLNLYPLTPRADLPNGGAVHWWSAWFETTQEQFDALRGRHGPEVVIQSNHPTDNGLAQHGEWSPGQIGDPDRWSDDFQAVEVLNAGSTDGLAFYLDLVARGWTVAAVGVTDSHHHFGGDPGTNGTWIHLGIDDPRELTDALLLDAFHGERTVATRGPFLELSILPGQTVSGAQTLSVQALSPSWIGVDRLLLLQDGVEVERVDGTQTDFQLSPATDAVFHVVAEGDTAMLPLTGRTPWAISGAIRVDVDGDGWTAPLPPLAVDGR